MDSNTSWYNWISLNGDLLLSSLGHWSYEWRLLKIRINLNRPSTVFEKLLCQLFFKTLAPGFCIFVGLKWLKWLQLNELISNALINLTKLRSNISCRWPILKRVHLIFCWNVNSLEHHPSRSAPYLPTYLLPSLQTQRVGRAANLGRVFHYVMLLK